MLQLAKARLIQGASRDTIEATKLGMRDAMKSAHMQVQAELRSRLGASYTACTGVEEAVQAVYEAAANLGGRDSELMCNLQRLLRKT